MKKFLFLVAIVLCGLSFQMRDKFFSKPIVINEPITKEVINKVWSKIKLQDKLLSDDSVITLYFNSPGGISMSTVVLLERISDLQSLGRKFKGVVYGSCFSACGSIFSAMDKRYMTENAVYMQHGTRHPRMIKPTRIDMLIDKFRLKHDSFILKEPVGQLIMKFLFSDFVADPKHMLNIGAIHGIVPQPNITEI